MGGLGRRTASNLATPKGVLRLVCATFVTLSVLVALGTPPWEANDEPSHAQNVETLRSGHWYRITHRSALESIQPPLYYLGLAAYAQLIGLHNNPTKPGPPRGRFLAVIKNGGLFHHDVKQDRADTSYVRGLRIPSILLGLLTILLAAAIAGLVSTDPWTPVVAAAMCAFVPRFVFASGVINNDSLATTLGATATFLAAYLVARSHPKNRELWLCAALGATAGAMVLTKFSTLTLLPGIALAVILAARHDGIRRIALLGGVFTGVLLAVCSWWLALNSAWYGDPLAHSAALDHFRDVFPFVLKGSGSFHALFIDLPKNVWRYFWYSSGWNQLRWSAWWYLPFWLLLATGLAGLARRPHDQPDARQRCGPPVLAVLALGAPAALFLLAIDINIPEARVAFMSLAAIAVLFALGFERLRLPVWARFALPAMGLVGTGIAIYSDVFRLYA